MTYQGDKVIGNFKTPRKKNKKKREGNDDAYLKKLRQLPCCVCGNAPPNTVHHLKATGERGGAMRSPDKYGVPMCMYPSQADCHGVVEAVGSMNEIAWFNDWGINPLLLAAELWAVKDDQEAMMNILQTHRSI